jgi:hypothetical protein
MEGTGDRERMSGTGEEDEKDEWDRTSGMDEWGREVETEGKSGDGKVEEEGAKEGKEDAGASKVKVRERAGWKEVLPEQETSKSLLGGLGLSDMSRTGGVEKWELDWRTGT